MFVRIKEHYLKILLGVGFFSLSIITIPNLAGLILTTSYGVPVGDDYAAIKEFSMTDNWPAAAIHSLANTGRYTQSITSSVAHGLLGDKAPVILPAITIIWLMLLIYAYTHLILKKFTAKSYTLISALITVLTMSLIASVNRPLAGDGTWFAYQMLFFSSAIVTYSIPLLVVLSLVYILLLRGRLLGKQAWVSMLLFGTIMYIIGLSNETLPATVIAVVPIIVIASFAYHGRLAVKNKLTMYSLVGAVASLSALLTLYFSPSSIKRRQLSTMASDTSLIGSVIERTEQMLSSYIFMRGDILLIVATSLIISLVITLHSRKIASQKTIKHATIIGSAMSVSSFMALLVATTLLVVGYGPSTPIYPRTLMIYQVLYVSGLMLFSAGIWMALLRTSRWSNNIKAVSICVATVVIIMATPGQLTRASSQITAAVQYKSAQKDLDHQLRSAETQDRIIVVEKAAAGIGDGFSLVCYGDNFERPNWLNVAIQEYYGIYRICSNPTPVEGRH